MKTAGSVPTLAHRLERRGSSGGQAGSSLVLSLFFGAIATALILYTSKCREGSEASGTTAEGHRVAWKIEVWGKVRGRADFQHPYSIEVA